MSYYVALCATVTIATAPINMSNKQHTNQLRPRTLEHILGLIYVYNVPLVNLTISNSLIMLGLYEFKIQDGNVIHT